MSIWICGCRSQCATDAFVGQLTIFYCGKVNVYEGVPPEKVKNLPYFSDTLRWAFQCNHEWFCRHKQSCTLLQVQSLYLEKIHLGALQHLDLFHGIYMLRVTRVDFSLLVPQYHNPCRQVPFGGGCSLLYGLGYLGFCGPLCARWSKSHILKPKKMLLGSTSAYGVIIE